MILSAKGLPTPLEIEKAMAEARVVPQRIYRAPFSVPKRSPLAKLRGCVGKRGMHSKSDTAKMNAAGPSGPRDSTVLRTSSKNPSGAVSVACAARHGARTALSDVRRGKAADETASPCGG